MQWWDELLSDSRQVVEELWREPLHDAEALRAEVVAYRAHVHAAARPATDLGLADRLAEATVALLGETAAATARARRLAQVAARYFVRGDDGEDDLTSPFGFDDDLEVFNAVVAALGAPERALAA